MKFPWDVMQDAKYFENEGMQIKLNGKIARICYEKMIRI